MYNLSARAVHCLNDSVRISRWIHSKTEIEHTFNPLPEVEPARADALQARMRTKVAIALLLLVNDHHTSLILLFQHRMRSSAFALGRCVFDAFWRAAWVAYAASGDEIDRFANGTYDPKPDAAIKRIEKLQELPPVLSELKTKTWSILSAYVHGGHHQVQRWVHEDTISPRHSDEEMIELLHLTNRIALLSAALLFDVTNREEPEFTALFDQYVSR
jgi:hypothetical protein